MATKGVALAIPGWSPTYGRRVYPDRRIAAGSLFLMDGTHSLGGFSGVPDAGLKIPNIASAQAAAILGSGDADSLAGVVYAGSSSGSGVGNQLKLERTAKGGVHGIISQVNQTTDPFWAVALPEAIRAYIAANYAHGIYVSVRSRSTRLQGASNPAPQSIAHMAQNTANYLFHMNGLEPAPFTVPPALGRAQPTNDSAATGTTGYKFSAIAVNALSGTGPGSNPLLAGVGSFGPWGYAGTRNKQPSRILYSLYVEDMQVSGRTFAEIVAIDQPDWAECIAPGGRIYGDTFTDPATFA